MKTKEALDITYLHFYAMQVQCDMFLSPKNKDNDNCIHMHRETYIYHRGKQHVFIRHSQIGQGLIYYKKAIFIQTKQAELRIYIFLNVN